MQGGKRRRQKREASQDARRAGGQKQKKAEATAQVKRRHEGRTEKGESKAEIAEGKGEKVESWTASKDDYTRENGYECKAK